MSVYGTDTIPTPYEAFLGSVGSVSLRGEAPPHHLSELTASWIFLRSPPTPLNPPAGAGLPFCVTPSVFVVNRQYGNVDPFSIGYAFRPGLRTVIVTAAVYWGFSSELRPLSGADPSL